MRYTVLTSTLLLFVLAAAAQDGRTVNQTQFPPSYIPSGQEMYKQFCAACHGADGKGDGPAASNLKTRPADLTTLASVMKESFHPITFPRPYALVQGFPLTAHKSNEKAVQERIKRPSAYLVSLQEK